MINFINNCNEDPYVIFREKYDKAISSNEKMLEAIAISSFDSNTNEVDSRYVNLKIVDGKEFIFFTNYFSPKSMQFLLHDQVSVVILWKEINVQIRMKSKIKKISRKYSQDYFRSRSKNKNALAISSLQSELAISYKEVELNYQDCLENYKDLSSCPSHWGGFSFVPFYFEFWEGHENRLNFRKAYKFENNSWSSFILQP